jgi:hypothetical protein
MLPVLSQSTLVEPYSQMPTLAEPASFDAPPQRHFGIDAPRAGPGALSGQSVDIIAMKRAT